MLFRSPSFSILRAGRQPASRKLNQTYIHENTKVAFRQVVYSLQTGGLMHDVMYFVCMRYAYGMTYHIYFSLSVKGSLHALGKGSIVGYCTIGELFEGYSQD